MDRNFIFNRSINRAIETRSIPECRAAAGRKIEGHAAVWNQRADLGKFHERIMPGAFDKVLASDKNIVALFNHDKNAVLGRVSAGTLRLKVDQKGLFYSIDAPDTTLGRDTYESVRRGDISGSSFAFALEKGDDDWDEEQGEDRSFHALRTIRNVSHLIDVSCVTTPAYQGTDAVARNVEVPYEIRASIASRNGGVIVTPEIALQITINAMERRAAEKDVIQRRKNLLDKLLS